MPTTETTVQSWGSRLGSSTRGVLVGFLLVLASVALLFWNEGRTVNRAKALSEGASAVISVDAAKVDPQNDGKLVHVSGEVATADVLEDLKFGVSVNAIKLLRKVESYQWREIEESTTERGSGGSQKTTTTYSYEKVWAAELIDSTGFKEAGRDNPSTRPVEGAEFVASNVSLGAFRLSADLISRLGPSKPFVPPVAADGLLPIETIVEIPQTVAQETISIAAPASAPNDATTISTAAPASAPNDATEFRRTETGFYLGADPNAPAIGDVRVSFEIVEAPRPASVVSQQNGDGFVPYQAKTGSVELLSNKIDSAEAMFAQAQRDSATLGWILRVFGFALMFFGFSAIFKPLEVLADIVPFLGSLVGLGTGLVSFALSLFGSLTTIAVAWLWFRPLIAIPLLIVAVGSLVWLFGKAKKAKVAEAK